MPLGEASERYRLQIMDGEAVRRAIEVPAPEANYSPEDQFADWGGLPDTLTFKVQQWSAIVGWGAVAETSETL